MSTSVSSNDDEWRSMQCQLWCLESRPGVAAARRLGPDTAVETWTPGTSLAPPKIARHRPAQARAAWLVTSPVPVTAAVEIILNTPALHWQTGGWHRNNPILIIWPMIRSGNNLVFRELKYAKNWSETLQKYSKSTNEYFISKGILTNFLKSASCLLQVT